jgi:tRNA pseudouridine55 synthase
LATGVLLVCVGPATRLIEYAQRLPKRYRATFLLGRHSPTDDIEGKVELLDGAFPPSRDELEMRLPQFVGRIQQQPPAFSAIKIKGHRAYAIARRGERPELSPRTVSIYSLRIAHYDYPQLLLDIECGSGTYVRALGRDLAAALGTAAVMCSLERTAIGSFKISEATHVDQLTLESLPKILLSPLTVLGSMPRLRLSSAEATTIRDGGNIRHQPTELFGRTAADTGNAEIVAVDTEGRLVAILAPADHERWRPLRTFPSVKPDGL